MLRAMRGADEGLRGGFSCAGGLRSAARRSNTRSSTSWSVLPLPFALALFLPSQALLRPARVLPPPPPSPFGDTLRNVDFASHSSNVSSSFSESGP
eukprot:2268202-Rhodomonas_salina.2